MSIDTWFSNVEPIRQREFDYPLRDPPPYKPTGIEVVQVEIAKLECQRGDTVVIKLPETWPADAIEIMADGVRRVIPDGVKIIILPLSCEISVLTAEDASPRPATHDPFKPMSAPERAFGLRHP